MPHASSAGARPGHRPAVPRISAGVIPYREAGDGACEIFWVRRSKALRFMGGWHAFPGGRLSDLDSQAPAHGRLDGWDAYAASGKPAAHVACALRELFEETGILAVRGTLPPAAEVESARGELLAESLDFGAWLRGCGLELDASRLCYAGRWVTPPLSPIRFDATFFLLSWDPAEARQPRVVRGELDRGEWIRAQSALEHWEAGEVLLAQPTLETIRVLAEDGPAGHRRLWRSEAHEPDSPHAIEFRPGIRVIPLESQTLPPATHTNALLVGGKDLVLIDPGSSSERDLRRLADLINEVARRTGGRLVGIWLTHHHPDHVAGTEAMRRLYGVRVWAHASTARQLGPDGVRVDRLFGGGEVVELAGRPALRMRVLHTPGHASGHLCFYEERSRTLLCGDMLSGFGTVVINPPDGSMAEYIESLEQLASLGSRVILPSHGSLIRDPAATLEAARSHRLRRETRVLEAWQAGRREPASILASAYGEVAAVARPLAERQVLAHLERLAALGRIAELPAELRAAIGRC